MSENSIDDVAPEVDSRVLMRQQGTHKPTWNRTALGRYIFQQTEGIRIQQWIGQEVKNPGRVRIMSWIYNWFDSNRVGDKLKTSPIQIARETGLDRRTIDKSLAMLVDSGHIVTFNCDVRNKHEEQWLEIELSAKSGEHLRREAMQCYVKNVIFQACDCDAAASWLLSQLIYFESVDGGVERDGKVWRVESPGMFSKSWGMPYTTAEKALARLQKLDLVEVRLWPFKMLKSRNALTAHVRIKRNKLAQKLGVRQNSDSNASLDVKPYGIRTYIEDVQNGE